MTSGTQIPKDDETFTVRILSNGVATLVSNREGETFHPEHGPATEARTLYIDQVRLDDRWKDSQENPLCVWDVGLGAAANSVEVIRSLRRAGSGRLRMLSFDRTLSPLETALATQSGNPAHFDYLSEVDWSPFFQNGGWHLAEGNTEIDWTWHLGDFVELMKGSEPLPAPDVIMYDCYSPARNWEMWTLEHWKRLLGKLNPARTTQVIFYSRSTALRVTLLLAGFCVGQGCATGAKEETTVASNRIDGLDHPFSQEWLKRVRRSSASHPFTGSEFQRRPLSEPQWEELLLHPQFAGTVQVAK